jgi:hypothetical protein
MERSRRNKGDKSATRSKEKDYVIVTVVEDMGKARDCKDLLGENDIPALIREQESAGGEACIAVLVPEEHLDEAHVIVESQDNYDDLYDLDRDDESDSDEEESDYGDKEGEEEY